MTTRACSVCGLPTASPCGVCTTCASTLAPVAIEGIGRVRAETERQLQDIADREFMAAIGNVEAIVHAETVRQLQPVADEFDRKLWGFDQ